MSRLVGGVINLMYFKYEKMDVADAEEYCV
jgi:hypothetical protein